MAKGMSLHVGLNRVQFAAYGWSGSVDSCENDALVMRDIAVNRGYKPTVLLTAEATRGRVVSVIKDAIVSLVAGDAFFITFSGHGMGSSEVIGGKVKADESWLLYDKPIIDDEIHGLLKSFTGGVRILVVSESCRSGTIILPPALLKLEQEEPGAGLRALVEAPPRLSIPPEVVSSIRRHFSAYFSEVEEQYKDRNLQELAAAVIQLSACQQDQDAFIDGRHGVFTTKLLDVWSTGRFSGSHINFFDQVKAKMPAIDVQNPNYLAIGQNVATFESGVPFTI